MKQVPNFKVEGFSVWIHPSPWLLQGSHIWPPPSPYTHPTLEAIANRPHHNPTVRFFNHLVWFAFYLLNIFSTEQKSWQFCSYFGRNYDFINLLTFNQHSQSSPIWVELGWIGCVDWAVTQRNLERKSHLCHGTQISLRHCPNRGPWWPNGGQDGL